MGEGPNPTLGTFVREKFGYRGTQLRLQVTTEGEMEACCNKFWNSKI